LKKEFALEHGGPKRLTISCPANLANAEVFLDSQRIMTFASKTDLLRGATCKLPDGSLLTVRYAPIEGARFLKGLHAVRNGLPIPGSAADPVPTWAWVFMAACGLIPIVTLGGGLPALLGFGGVSATLSVSRINRWSVALRAGVCALITVACWSGLLLVSKAMVAAKVVSPANAPLASLVPAPTSPDKLVHDIGVVYYNHGYLQLDIDKIKDNLQDHCDQMQPAQCMEYLRAALAEAKKKPDIY
jgi:hypothetical protein